MEFITKSSIVSHTILNEATGELESKNFTEVSKSKRIKGGFNMIYHKSYEEVTESVISSNKDLRLFNWITNKFTYTRTETPLLFSDCSVNVSQPTFSKMIKRLVELDYLKRVGRGVYRLNPYIYVPYKGNAQELQEEWREL